MERCSSLKYTYFTNVIILILHTSLALISIYFRYKSLDAKLITLQISMHRVENYLSLYFVKYSPHQKLFPMKVVDLNEVHILQYITFFDNELFLRKSIKFYFSFI
jgi:hypothetical protein